METLFLACFAFGALFTLASIVLGSLGGPVGAGHAHPGHAAHAPAAHAPHAAHAVHAHVQPHLSHAGPVGAHGDSAATGHALDDGGLFGLLPLLNASSFIGGLTWFGAAGYLLLRLGDWALPAVLLGAVLAGAVGWYVIARFLGLVLAGEREMDPDDYRLEGTVANVTVGIPAGGTGEVVFSKSGARRSEAARAVGGKAIPRGTEVVISAFQDGFATVQPWGEFLAARESLGAAEQKEAN